MDHPPRKCKILTCTPLYATATYNLDILLVFGERVWLHLNSILSDGIMETKIRLS